MDPDVKVEVERRRGGKEVVAHAALSCLFSAWVPAGF